MKFVRKGEKYRNGIGEIVDLEDTYLYPMLKSSDIVNGATDKINRWMLVPQRFVGENTRHIKEVAPKTWQYLKEHAELLDRRASSIYKNRPRFSIFGVGAYTFAPWKVAISGFYKDLKFRAIGPYQKKPVVFDDTCYFVSCKAREEAELLVELLNSKIAQKFLSAFIFWDSKRPITVDLLKRLDLFALANESGREEELKKHLGIEENTPQQMSLF